ncbi:phytanoyl-CoA dioxygenase family protein [Pantoea dispersa]|uniref:phytanoyl-CoA dioxygenase family protein n=1 Tax=Pantoea dispersa TaxID=59814 RepID=UPI000736ED62|nr:phytanoyl-CoA dioxygenase family protein [Pantoea dispersa]
MTESVKKTYDENGYVVIKNAISSDLLQRLRDHFERTSERHSNVPPEKWNFWLFENDDEWLRLINDAEILDQVEKILGTNIIHLGSHYWSKPPRIGQPVSWHQDGAYYELSHMSFVTIWIALDRSVKENGCLKVIPGTHKEAFKPLISTNDDPFLKRKMDVTSLDDSESIYIELEPGDVSLHNPNIYHGSERNESDLWRRGFVIKFISGDVDIAPEMDWPWAYLVRGECTSEVTRKILKDGRPQNADAPA